MRSFLRAACVVGVVGAMASPALAIGPEIGAENRAASPPSDTPRSNGSETGSARSGATPRSTRAFGVVCAREEASRSNENDADPGTPFSRCVRELAQATRQACMDEPKQRAEGDTEPGTPFSRCVRELARGLRTGSREPRSDRGQSRIACERPDFDSGAEFGRCVRTMARALRNA